MGRLERVREIARRLEGGRAWSTDELCRDLEVSRSTVKRDLAYLTDRLQAPVRWDAARGAWSIDRRADGGRVEVPGLWFSVEEIHALMTLQQWLTSLDAGAILEPHIGPLARRLGRILAAGVPSSADVARRIRVIPLGARPLRTQLLSTLGHALLERRQLRIVYRARSSGVRSERAVSPQRLVHYRDNWYLEAWCHWRAALRRFSVDAIAEAGPLDAVAREIDEAALDAEFGASYGIFAGPANRHAQLRCSAHKSRWVAVERWHPLQLGRYDREGRWLLTVPYADPTELVMDILRHVPDVEVIAPDELRGEVVRRMREGLRGMEGLDE